MHGLDACDICGRQVPTGFTRGELWRLGWEWSTFVTFKAVGYGICGGYGFGYTGAKPVSMRTRWVCGACWPWELLVVESIRTTFLASAECLALVRRIRRVRPLLSVETGRLCFSHSNPYQAVAALEEWQHGPSTKTLPTIITTAS